MCAACVEKVRRTNFLNADRLDEGAEEQTFDVKMECPKKLQQVDVV